LRFDAIVEPPPPGAWTAEELSAAKFPAFLAGRCIKL
jgi:hypothetical protein